MTDQPTSTDQLDWRVLNSAQTELLPEQIQQAVQLSRSIRFADQRWQVYLSALGTLGFQQWIRDRAPDLTVQIDAASIWRPAYANLLTTACNVRVGAFKVCVVTVGSWLSDEISVSIAALDLPDFAAHFYVLMQVLEEEDQAAVTGFFTYDQYRRASLQAESDWTYAVPFEWFNPDANALLLNLRCLEPDSIRLPQLDVTRSSAALREKLSSLDLATQSPWDFLSVEEGLTLLNDPALVNLFAPVSTQPRLINAGLWLGDRLDTVAQELGWRLMSPSLLSGMRSLRPLRNDSLREDFDSIRSSLEHQGVEIPVSARGAYRDLRSDQGEVRLYAVTWILSEAIEQPEWMLLIALGAVPETAMPDHLKLTVSDAAQVLVDESMQTRDRGVLYAQVIGNWGEQFWVTVTANESAVFEIPPFSFELNEAARSGEQR